MKKCSLMMALLVIVSALSAASWFFSENARAATWGSIIEISSDVASEGQWSPDIAVRKDRVHVVWMDYEDGDSDIYYRHFNGAAWLPEQEISVDLGDEHQSAPSIAVDSEYVHVVWQQLDTVYHDIYYTRFNGHVWEPPIELSTDDVGYEWEQKPSIAAEHGRAYVVWEEKENGDWDIYYRHFDGIAWQPEMEISTDETTAIQEHPSIAVQGGKVHVVWSDGGDGTADIYYRQFDGRGWLPEVEVSSLFPDERQYRPDVAVDADKVHVVWEDCRGGNCDIHYRCFDGKNWHMEEEISNDSADEDQYEPVVASEGPRVHVAWDDTWPADDAILYRYFDGTSWQPEELVNDDPYDTGSLRPGIAVDDCVAHVAWQNLTVGSYYDIFYRKGTETCADLLPPESQASPVSPYWTSDSDFDVNWTAIDDVDLANISLMYRHSSNNSTWSAWEEYSRNDSISGTFAMGSFSFTSLDGEGYYEFFTLATDSNNRQEAAPASADSATGVATPPSPPSDFTASLSGNRLENVTLSWSLSPDDGPGMVNSYDLRRSTTYNPSGSDYPVHASVPSGTSSCEDVLSGDGDLNSYFYVVCAVVPSDVFSCVDVQAVKVAVALQMGPNLVSIPVTLPDYSIEEVLQTVSFDRVLRYNTSDELWVKNDARKAYEKDFSEVNRTVGVWVNVTSPSNLAMAGTVPAQTVVQLHEGWNLIGFPSFDSSYTVADLKAETGATRVEGFDPSAPPHYLEALSDGDCLQAGYGYWVKVDTPVTWVVGSG